MTNSRNQVLDLAGNLVSVIDSEAPDHTHSEYATADHTHSEYVTDLGPVSASVPFSSPAAEDYYEIEMPFAGTITAWRILADAESDIQFDLWKDTYANYPPTNDDSMCDGNEPALSSTVKGEATDLSAWTTTSFAAGDIIRVYVDSVSTEHTLVTLVLALERS